MTTALGGKYSKNKSEREKAVAIYFVFPDDDVGRTIAVCVCVCACGELEFAWSVWTVSEKPLKKQRTVFVLITSPYLCLGA